MPIRKIRTRYKNILNVVLVALAVIFFWRGIWQLMDHYLFPENPMLSNWISLIIGLILLIILELQDKGSVLERL